MDHEQSPPPRPDRPSAAQIELALARCLAAEAALDALDEDFARAPVDLLDALEETTVARADRDARDELIGCLLALLGAGPLGPVAVVLGDGTIVAYSPDPDGLAIVPPGRVTVTAGARHLDVSNPFGSSP